ncbi:MAG: GNAT family N-acetyltransferase [Ardenticatenaceae bacterium]|nr:GNAT family N-acetyltransferase [Ardenticatenaceae bacterium]
MSTKSNIQLRNIQQEDLQIFFDHQQDQEALSMAAFTAKEPHNWTAFQEHWNKIMADQSIVIKTIVNKGQIAGYVLSHSWFGEPEITYWIGREFWGKGVATAGLHQFLEIYNTRPLFARVAHDNSGSIKVLQKCGFQKTGEDRGFANARQQEIVEFIFALT